MSDCHGGTPRAGLLPNPSIRPPSAPHDRPIIVAIVGPPNSGKSTLFNRLTGLRQKVANFPGVTVEHRMGKAKLKDNHEVFLVDLPGVYSLHPRAEDEQVTHDVLKGLRPDFPKPDAVVLILDSTNLGRHLVLAAPILDLGLPTLVLLNMADDLAARGGKVDITALQDELNCNVALISAAKGTGIDRIQQFLIGTAVRLNSPPPRIELPVLHDVPKCRQWAATLGKRASYRAPAPPLWTRRLDSVFLHPVAGPLIFLAVVMAVFQSIFSWAKPVMDGLQDAVASSGVWFTHVLPDSPWRSLLVDGVWKGVGSVVVFLPQILLLFLFIGILEDSGYLARAALIADRTMAKFGLQGKSFIPLLSAYACAVPAVMATRVIENKRDRLATIMIAPLMTCSARLPVYTLLIAAFIPNRKLLGDFLSLPAAIMLGLYILGFLTAVVIARVLKSSILKSRDTNFILEMPPYRWPTVRSLSLRLVDRAKVFLHRAGTVILLVAICIWVLAHLPLHNGHAPDLEHSLAGSIGKTIEPAIKPLGFNWKIGIGLITSLAAREVIVGTLGTIYGVEIDEPAVSSAAKTQAIGEPSHGLEAAIHQDLSTAGAIALLVFFAYALQCFSTLAVVKRETGGWRWPLFQFSYMLALAYSGSWLAFHIASYFLH
ncbi:MAG TPA: ferrous iron transporter B [Bryobacteraceae bacterium]|jgi:ferrous iron transport protein B|nr:ferrous iron transporter B [Bryobacteraceae bacterium]